MRSFVACRKVTLSAAIPPRRQRMSYIDGFVIAVPNANREQFIGHAHTFDAIFLEFGATRVLECWGDDVPEGKLTDFRRAVQATPDERSEEHTSELQSLMRISYAVFCLKKKKHQNNTLTNEQHT